MTAAWAAAAVALAAAAISGMQMLLRQGQREGKVDQVLERLTDIAADHEGRLRALEAPASRASPHRRR